MLNRLVLVVILVPCAVVLIALAVANRAGVPFTLDPFNPGNPALTLRLPLFVLLFLTLALGMLIGGAATWLRQGRYRKMARQRADEAERLRQTIRTIPGQAPVHGSGAAPTGQSTALTRA